MVGWTDLGSTRSAAAVTTGSSKTRSDRRAPWPVIRTEAVEENTFHAQLEVSNFPSILGTTEVTELLGVSRQRLHELRNSRRFPAPAYEVAATPLWIRSTVDSFLAGWERKPGRPVQGRETPRHE